MVGNILKSLEKKYYNKLTLNVDEGKKERKIVRNTPIFKIST